MSKLKDQTCHACSIDSPSVPSAEARQLLLELPEWEIVEHDGISQLQRSYPFRNFRQALAFTNQVGALAEEVGHHPALQTEWGKVKVAWWTHAIGGLHRNDFICAARTDALHQSP